MDNRTGTPGQRQPQQARRVDIRALTKMQRMEYKDTRRTKLREKSDTNARFGQGKRNEEFYVPRRVMFEMAMKATAPVAEMVQAVSTNRLYTREFTARMQEQRQQRIPAMTTDKLCPICQATGKQHLQTKEHIFSGECKLTEDISDA